MYQSIFHLLVLAVQKTCHKILPAPRGWCRRHWGSPVWGAERCCAVLCHRHLPVPVGKARVSPAWAAQLPFPHLLWGTVGGLKLCWASFTAQNLDSAALRVVLRAAKCGCEWQGLVTGWVWWGWWLWLNNFPCLWAHTHTQRKWSSFSVQLRKTLFPKWTINAWKKSEKWISLWPF